MRILVVTSDNNIYIQIANSHAQLNGDEFELERVNSYQAALEAFETSNHAIVLIDSQLAGEQYLHETRMTDSWPATIILVRPGDTEIGITALKAGADDYIDMTRLDAPLLNHYLRRAVEHKQLKKGASTQNTLVDALKDAATAINSSTLDLDQILNRILVSIGKVIPYDAANIMLIEDDIAHVVYFQGYTQPEFTLDTGLKIIERPDLRQIVESQQALLLADVHMYPGWPQVPKTTGIRSHIGLPLLLRGEIIGVLNLDSAIPANFTTLHSEWLQVFAECISAALYQTRLYYDEEKQRQESKTLRKVTQLVTSTLELDRLMELMLVHLQTIVPYDTVTVFLAEGDYLEIVANRGCSHPDHRIGQRIVANQYALFRELAQTKHPLFSSDTRTDSRFADWFDIDYKPSWLGVPLLAHGTCIGFVTLGSDQVATYGRDEETLVHSFANQVAIAIFNAQLYEEIHRYADELEERVAQRTAELQNAHEAIKRSEHRYRTLFEATFEGICVHEEGLVLDVNPVFSEMFGYSPAEMIGMQVLDFAVQESRELIQSKITAEDDTPFEATGLRKDGTQFHVEILGKKHTYEERTVRVAALRDITERKKVQQQQLELTLERERMRILANFIAQAAHEFRTPLSIIGTSIYLLKKLGASEEQMQRLDTIEAQSRYITRLIENMVTLLRLDSREQEHIQEKVDLNQIILDAKNMLNSLFQENQHEVKFELSEKPLWLWGHAENLCQAVKALLENAGRFTPPGGMITVRSICLEDSIELNIIDTGIGISEEDLPHIFEHFFRADKAGTTRGFGLGLSIAKVIIDQHQGQISMDSELDRGSIFRIQLPSKCPE